MTAAGHLFELAGSWANGQSLPDEPAIERDIYSQVIVKVLIRSGRAKQALSFLAKACHVLEANGQNTRLIGFLVLQALAHDDLGHSKAAIQSLQHALELGEDEGFIRTFLDEGRPLAHLMERLLKRFISPSVRSNGMSTTFLENLG